MLVSGIVITIGSILIGIVAAIVTVIKANNDDNFEHSAIRTKKLILIIVVCGVLFFIGVVLISIHFLFRIDEALSLTAYLGSFFLPKRF